MEIKKVRLNKSLVAMIIRVDRNYRIEVGCQVINFKSVLAIASFIINHKKQKP
jgi:hypothetical protein